ncbi:MAG: DUF131 domain-containing protein [Thermoplasmatota archaeon]
MGWLRILGVVILIAGMAGLVVSALAGEMAFHLLLIVPIISISGPIGILSVLTAIIGGMMILFSYFGRYRKIGMGSDEDGSTSSMEDLVALSSSGDYGGIIFLGPFPIVFGNRSFREKLPGWFHLLLIGVILFIVLQLGLMILFIII